MQKTQQTRQLIDIYKVAQTIRVPVDQVMSQSLKEVQKYITSLVGFSSSLFLYQFPVTSFNRLDFINPNTTLKTIFQSFGQVCFTFNNKQYAEQHMAADHFSNIVNDLSLVIQTYQDNYFSYKRYKIDSKGKLNFVKCLANRNGQNIQIQYYGLRLSLDEFHNNQPILGTLSQFVYENNTIILTSDEFEDGRQYRTVKDPNIIDFTQFYLIYVQDVEYPLVMDRRAKWEAVLSMLSFIFKVNLVIKKQEENQQKDYQVSNSCKEIYLLKIFQKVQIIPSLQNSFFLGQTLHYLVFLQQSCKLRLYSNQPPFQHINSVILNSSSSIYLEQDIPVLLGEKLLMYNITIKTITLKYYTFPLAELSYVQNYKWSQDFGAVQADTLDVISVPLRKERVIRIFYVYKPNNYLEVKCNGEWTLFTGRLGKNINSDGSGLITIKIKDKLSIYNLKNKVLLYTICPNKTSTLSSVHFFPKQGKMLLTYLSHFQEYTKDGQLVTQGKKDAQEEVYCYTQNGRMFKMTENMFQITGKSKLRVKNGLVRLEQSFVSFNWLQVIKFQSIYLSKQLCE